MEGLIELIAITACGLFAGAALYISAVEHPARMSCGTVLAATEFVPSYKRAAVMQASLAGVGLVLGLMAWLNGGGMAWLLGTILIGAVIPFTLVAVRPVNDALLAPSLDRSSEQARTLLDRWAVLHWVRSVYATAAFLLMLAGHGDGR